MSNQEELGKMFVGGLSWETTQDALCRYFSRFGEVIDSVVMKNPETGRSRGFGFVTFKDPCCVQIVLDSGAHTLDSRTVDPKACNPRTEQKPSKTTDKGQYPKIFLGGLPSNVTETDLKSYFSKYGNVVAVVIMYDQEKKRTRGFGFVSFLTEDCVDRVCAEQYVTINGKQVECKKAEPRESSRGAAGGFSRRAMRGPSGPNRGRGGMQQTMGGPPVPTMGMPNGMGYQPQGWGPPPPQGGFPSQGAWMSPNSFPAAGPGYGWGPQPGPYGAYNATGAQFGPPQNYGGYGYGYGWPGQVPTPVPAPNGAMASAQSAGSSDSYAAAGQSTLPTVAAVTDSSTASVPPGQAAASSVNLSAVKSEFGAYAAQSYSFTPTAGSFTGQSDVSKSNSFGGTTGGRPGATQAYHPYRRT